MNRREPESNQPTDVPPLCVLSFPTLSTSVQYSHHSHTARTTPSNHTQGYTYASNCMRAHGAGAARLRFEGIRRAGNGSCVTCVCVVCCQIPDPMVTVHLSVPAYPRVSNRILVVLSGVHSRRRVFHFSCHSCRILFSLAHVHKLTVG